MGVERKRRHAHTIAIHHADGCLKCFWIHASEYSRQQAAHFRVGVVPPTKEDEPRTGRRAQSQKPRKVEIGRHHHSSFRSRPVEKRFVGSRRHADLVRVYAFVSVVSQHVEKFG